MIFIMAQKYAEARDVALAAGFTAHPADRRWLHLTWQAQLMGQYKPQVVMLHSARLQPHFRDIEEMLYDREATIWSEMDLITGKVPR